MILAHSDMFCNSTLRGGGVCTSSSQTKNLNELNNQQGNLGLTNYLILKLKVFDQEIEDVKEMLDTQKGKEVLVKYVKWYEDSEQQFLYFLDFKVVKWDSKAIENSFSQYLSIIPSLIKREKLLSLQLLKICNCLSRIIFYYFTHKENKEKCEQVGVWQDSIQQIKQQLEYEGELQLFYNGICYELSIIELCIGALPTKEDSDTEKELLKSAFFGIFNSVTSFSLSDDLTDVLKDGAKHLYKRFQNYQSSEKFNHCFKFEQLKWLIIHKLEDGKQFETTKSIISQTYTQIVTKKNDWSILYSWIKIISELMVYKPKITKQNFQKIQETQNEKIDWDKAIQLKYIKPIRGHEYLAEISIFQQESTLCIFTHLNNVQTDFRSLQDFLINGNEILPPFLKYYQLNQVEMKNDDQVSEEEIKIQQIIQRINCIPFQEISNYLTELIQVFQNYQENYIIISDKQYFTSRNMQENKLYQLSNIRQLYNQNQQLLERIISYSTFQTYLDELLLNLNNLCGVLDEKMKSQTKLHVLISFVQQGLKCFTNYQQIDEEQFIKKTFIILPENTLQSEIATLEQERKKNSNFIKNYDLKKNKETYKFNQQLFKVLEFHDKFKLKLNGLIEKLFEDKKKLTGQLIRIRNNTNDTMENQEFSHNNDNEKIQFIENQVDQDENKQEYYQILISIFHAIQGSVLDFKENLQDNLIIQDLKENLNQKENKQLEFKISLLKYICIYRWSNSFLYYFWCNQMI